MHTRLGRADQTTHFAATLPAPQSDLARAVMKAPYNFELLTVAQGPCHITAWEAVAGRRGYLTCRPVAR